MIYSETHQSETLDNEELVEILDMINKEAFTETEVFSIGFGNLMQSKNPIPNFPLKNTLKPKKSFINSKKKGKKSNLK